MTETTIPEALQGLEPEAVWRNFAEFAARPRPSGLEGQVREYVLNWARSFGFGCGWDDIGNLVVRVPGRGKGVESEPVIIQGHMDMVCEKNENVEHDFERDPIVLRRVEDRIFASDTTLGADNGIGVALGMAAAEGLFEHHPPLELLLTVDEETGMSGARELDVSMLSAKRMINLDAEEEGTLYVGCAGGQDSIAALPLERDSTRQSEVSMEIVVKGLRGGHSGLDIICNRGNAISLLTSALQSLREQGLDFALVEFKGGSKRNALAREARAVVSMKLAHATKLPDILGPLRAELHKRHLDSEPNFTLMADRVADELAPLTEDTERALLRYLYIAPHGVSSMSQAVPGLVETSTNLGVVRVEGGSIEVVSCTRSSNGAALNHLVEQITVSAELCGLLVRHEGGYPGWQPNMKSELLAVSEKVFTKLADGEKPEVTAIHAGLECGLLGGLMPELDMISFGPDIQDAHGPDESVSIDSVAVVARQVGALLEALCEVSD